MTDDTAPTTGARLLTATLAANGIATIFATAGAASPALRVAGAGAVAVEIAGDALAVGALARAAAVASDRPGVCAVVGLAEARAALGEAADDDPARLVLVAPSTTDAAIADDAVAARVKAVIAIDRAEDVAAAVGRGLALAASGKPGAVLVRLADGVLVGEAAVPAVIPAAPVIETHPGAARMWDLQKRLWAAKRPLAILGGAGWSATARRRFDRFAEKFDLPIVGAARPIPADRDDPRSLGALGADADPALLARLASADLILAIGVAFARDRDDLARPMPPTPHQMLVHVHPDVAELVRVRLPDLAVHATVAAFAAAAEALEPPPAGVAWKLWRETARAERLARLAKTADGGEK
ncbi:MAG: hypothetical protein GX458_21555 [Phyllobacteriaceae bacterium]|nr:hypothetical protein [Phyllobacteriaceae bacterium]